MATLALDNNHDLYADVNDNLALSFGVNEVIQQIKQNILALGISAVSYTHLTLPTIYSV